jgi:hypothetical protein
VFRDSGVAEENASRKSFSGQVREAPCFNLQKLYFNS